MKANRNTGVARQDPVLYYTTYMLDKIKMSPGKLKSPITFITTSIYQVANFVNYGAVLQIAVEDFVHDRFGVQRHL